MTDLILCIIATIAFFNLNWNIAGLIMGLVTIADLWLTNYAINKQQGEK